MLKHINMENIDKKTTIINNLAEKAQLKQLVYDNTFKAFSKIKKLLEEIVEEYNKELEGKDDRIVLVYKDRGSFEVELKVAGDLLIFSMHSNVFEFDREHNVWKLKYVSENKSNSYCGMINIYNFLYDSFKYNRLEDLGYLITRIFINKDNHFFVEGKRQAGYLYNNFESNQIDENTLKEIIKTSIIYSLEFDLLVPPYDRVKIASVAQLNEKMEYSRLRTGKRLGFKFNSDDVS